MKIRMVLFVVLAVALACALVMAQNPPAGAAGRGGGQRGGPPVPPATGPMLDVANAIAAAINKQDAAALQKMVAPDAVYLDEDGHAPPVARWITALTTGTTPKKIEISMTHGQMWNDTGWVSFNYVIAETFQEKPKNVRGTASLVLKKAPSGEWLIQMIHGALYQKVAGLTDGE
jgi:ketosteroid isomerase-like protein